LLFFLSFPLGICCLLLAARILQTVSTFLTAEWRKLIMAQYDVKPKLLMPYLPKGVELDLYEGRCYVSLVAFLFDRVRLKGLPIPFHTRFEEINLRFYVRRTEPDGTYKRGVVFIREFVPRRAIAYVAKHLYEEPYAAIPTNHRIRLSSESLTVGYGWDLGGRSHSLSVEAAPIPHHILANSEEDFITEHYWGYTKRSDGTTSAYQVEHPSWQTYKPRSYEIAVDFGLLYGQSFAFLTDQWVSSVLLAEGSAVSVHSGSRLSA
jgi:uncharacterized protein YqjF (DUF2071 family)